MIPSTVSPSSTLEFGQSLLPGRILALFRLLQPCPIIAQSIDTSLPLPALSPTIVDFMEQFLPQTVFSNRTPVSKLVPDINLEFSFKTVPGLIWTFSPSDVSFSIHEGPSIREPRPILTSPLTNTGSPGLPISFASLGGSAARFRRTQFTPFRYPFNSPTSTQNESEVKPKRCSPSLIK